VLVAVRHHLRLVFDTAALLCVVALKSRSGKPLTRRADLLRRNAMKAKAQRRRERLGFLSTPDTRLKPGVIESGQTQHTLETIHNCFSAPTKARM
jgi:hypothetical protein